MRTAKRATEADIALGLTIVEVARKLGCSREGVKWHQRQGKFPSARKDSQGLWRIDPTDVRKLLGERKPGQSMSAYENLAASAEREDKLEREHRRRMAAEDDQRARAATELRAKLAEGAEARAKRDAAMDDLRSLTLNEYDAARVLGLSGSDVRLLAKAGELPVCPIPESLRDALRGQEVGMIFSREDVARFKATLTKVGHDSAVVSGHGKPAPALVERLGRHFIDTVVGALRSREEEKT